MNFESLTNEATRLKVAEAISNLLGGQPCSHLDVFLNQDFCSSIQGNHFLEIQDNDTGNTVTYITKDALIDTDSLSSGAVTYILVLQEKDKNVNIARLFNISKINPNTDSATAMTNPKYYIYCDGSENIDFRFWFLARREN